MNYNRIIGLVFLIVFIFFLVIFFNSSYYNLIFIITSCIYVIYGLIFLDIFNKHTIFEDPIATKYPSVSVLIPAHNEEESIVKTINAVKNLEYKKPLEIIVLDDGSTDNTYNYIKDIKGIKVIKFEKNKGKAAVLNHGISIAKGELVIVIDADTYPKKEALMKMVGYFEDQTVGAVTTVVTVDKPKTLLQKLQSLEYYAAFGFWHKSLSAIDGLYVTPGPMSIYRKSALLKIKGYDEENITEDMEIALNLKKHGYKLACCTNTKVVTGVPKDIKSYIRQRLRWYRGAIYNSLFKHRSMHFNSQNKEFGFFIFPLFVATIFIASSLFFGILFLNTKILINTFYSFLMNISNGGFNWSFLYNWDFFMIPVYYLDMIIIASIWGYFLYKGIKLDKERDINTGSLSILFYLFFYGLILGGMYFLSITYEALGIRKKW
ncbi:MAG: glycosyltransferase family 2 protein [Candidatus Nanoarchaeia archaeon]|nr:glycosyltransferase family 2 protein [Candidatus Nanoarchaeia archaeon]